jgi:hypothetical protein
MKITVWRGEKVFLKNIFVIGKSEFGFCKNSDTPSAVRCEKCDTPFAVTKISEALRLASTRFQMRCVWIQQVFRSVTFGFNKFSEARLLPSPKFLNCGVWLQHVFRCALPSLRYVCIQQLFDALRSPLRLPLPNFLICLKLPISSAWRLSSQIF